MGATQKIRPISATFSDVNVLQTNSNVPENIPSYKASGRPSVQACFGNGPEMEMLVDSGATKTIISEGVAELYRIPTRKLPTATLTVPRLIAAGGTELKITSYYDGPVTVMGRTVPHLVWVIAGPYMALLGMDFTTKLRMKLDLHSLHVKIDQGDVPTGTHSEKEKALKKREQHEARSEEDPEYRIGDLVLLRDLKLCQGIFQQWGKIAFCITPLYYLVRFSYDCRRKTVLLHASHLMLYVRRRVLVDAESYFDENSSSEASEVALTREEHTIELTLLKSFTVSVKEVEGTKGSRSMAESGKPDQSLVCEKTATASQDLFLSYKTKTGLTHQFAEGKRRTSWGYRVWPPFSGLKPISSEENFGDLASETVAANRTTSGGRSQARRLWRLKQREPGNFSVGSVLTK